MAVLGGGAVSYERGTHVGLPTLPPDLFREKREQLEGFQGLLPGRQVQNLTLTVLHVPCSLDSSLTGRLELPARHP